MVPIEGTNLGAHDLELLPLVIRCLLGLVVWYGHLMATFDGFSYPEQLVLVFEPSPTPPTNPSNGSLLYAGLKLEKIISKALKSSHQPLTKLAL